uniref:Major facilitator superfamily (MFS) profile domain-containing protein n=1 Tax=Cucumis sativus TaxID=3659 RepID=A0A0A0LAW8_CUCSA
MRGRHVVEVSSTYKRGATKDHINAYDKQEGSVRHTGYPSWRRPFPHVVVATLASFLFGYHLGVVNETLESISLDLAFSGSTLAEGLVVSTCLGGAFLGSLFSGWIADGVGRRRALQLCALPMIIGASMSATTKNLWGMLLGRLFVGTGMGLGPAVAALYVSEVSPAYVRGTFGSFTQISSCLGLLGSLFMGLQAKGIVGWWRACFWVSVIPAALLALLMEFSAESPHWLFKSGRTAEAEAEFEKLLGGADVKYAYAELSKSDKGEDSGAVKLSELLHGRHHRVVFIGSTLFALQQLSGINAVFYFSSSVFKSFGVPSDRANICIGVANFLGSIVAMILMDKLGRRVLLLGSFSGMVVSMGLQVFGASSFPSSTEAFYLSAGGMLLFVLTFSLGAGPVPSLLLSEIFPSRIRAKAMAFCMSVHWVINFFVGLLFLPLLEQIGAQILYTVFGAFCLISVIFVKRNVVETKGKSLQEIEMALLPVE